MTVKWIKSGEEISYQDMMALFDNYEESLDDDRREECQAARHLIGKVEGDGVTILPESHPDKSTWLKYFGVWMVANNIVCVQ